MRQWGVLASGMLALTGLVVASEQLAGQALAACPGGRSDLLTYAGTSRTTDVLTDPSVAGSLGRLLGNEQAHLERNLAVAGSIDLVACHLVISGNAEHQGGIETGIVTISLLDGSVSAAIQSASSIRIFADGGDYLAVPVAIRDWVAVAATGFESRFAPPPGAERLSPSREGAALR